jgi:lysylphosphatidylglycerol synthetase-like protein (DUF2156 family)
MDTKDQSSSRIGELRTSARGWHGVQLAVLGFIGLCGVLQQDAGSGKPHWLQVLAGLLALAAFGIACLATVLVALAAWPVYAPRPRRTDDDGDVESTSKRLRSGITLTYVAVAVIALATSSGWWPAEAKTSQASSAVEVTTRAGQICGDLASPSGHGVLAISAGGHVVELALSDVVSLTPVDAC